MAHPHLTVVCVHGLLSSVDAWSQFTGLLGSDPELAAVEVLTFGYASPALSLRPDRQIPQLDHVADNLWTYLTHDLGDRRRLVLVTHSQGGLAVQRMLARRLADGHGEQLHRIRRIVMFACPNSGAEIMLLLRRWFSRHPQERELRPLDDTVLETQRRVLNQVVHATTVGPDRCPIRIAAYAGERDGVVKPAVAMGVFPETGVLPGDHSSIIRPDSHRHRSYTALKFHLDQLLAAEPDLSGDLSEDAPMTTVPAGHRRDEQLVDQLLAVPGMRDRAFRDQLYRRLPAPVQDQLPRLEVVRTEMFALVETLSDYRHLRAWEALLTALSGQVPGHPQVAGLRRLTVEMGLIGPSDPRPAGADHPPRGPDSRR